MRACHKVYGRERERERSRNRVWGDKQLGEEMGRRCETVERGEEEIRKRGPWRREGRGRL